MIDAAAWDKPIAKGVDIILLVATFYKFSINFTGNLP